MNTAQGEAMRVAPWVSAQRLRFYFDGREYSAQLGDTAASALLAHGVQLLGRSVKFRRPRGLLAAGAEEPNALLTVGSWPEVLPNTQASLLVLEDGMELRSQNRWPTLRWDLGAVLQWGQRILGAGFYYKTFMWPGWRTYEPLIRCLAGLGEAPGEGPIPESRIEHLTCDVLVIGAGPAGLSAALAASGLGTRVVVCEREPHCGGELDFETAAVAGMAAREWVTTSVATLESRGARVLRNAAVVAGTDEVVIAHAAAGCQARWNPSYRIRAQSVVIATGAVERLIAFVDNDLPGVMLLSAAERILARYGVAAGRRVVLFGNHDRLYYSARRLMDAGIRIEAVIDTRQDSVDMGGSHTVRLLREQLLQAGVPCLSGHVVVAAVGRRKVRAARVARIVGGPEQRIECDGIWVSGGWSPLTHLGLHKGGFEQSADREDVSGGKVASRTHAGAAAGILDLAAVLMNGFEVGYASALRVMPDAEMRSRTVGGFHNGIGDGPPRVVPFSRSPTSLPREKRQFVDLQNDVTVADLRQALDEGFTNIEHIKRYTTLGIGTDQGRTGGILGADIVAELRGAPLIDVRLSRARPPCTPVTLGALVGHRRDHALRALRRTALHDWHESHGAVMEPADLWMRPRFYRANGNSAFDAGVVEAHGVRANVGIFDGSTLGKLRVSGRDAGAFLDTLYLTRASTIKVGRARYMVTLREDGMVLDDGIVLRLAEDSYLATTSTGHAEQMLAHFEYYRDTQWAGKPVAVIDVTEAWAVIVIAGPQSRAILSGVLGDDWRSRIDKLPHMAFETGCSRDADVLLIRAGFSGELAFELHCRPDIAPSLWESLVEAGASPYGLEALDILRVEKGYLTDAELNGQTTPFDVGLEKMVALNNQCVGRALLERPAFHEASRPRLVGLKAADGNSRLLAGAQMTAEDGISVGWIASSVYSPALRQWIALGFVARSHAALQTLLTARDPLRGADTLTRVSPVASFDPAGERMKS